MTSFPVENHPKHVLGIIREHIVNGLTVSGAGFMGNQVFDWQFSLVHQPQDQVAVPALAPGIVQVRFIGRFGLVSTQDRNLAQMNLGEKTHFHRTSWGAEGEQTAAEPWQGQSHGIYRRDARCFNDQVRPVRHTVPAHRFSHIGFILRVDTYVDPAFTGFLKAEVVEIHTYYGHSAAQSGKSSGQLAHNAHSGYYNGFPQLRTGYAMTMQ